MKKLMLAVALLASALTPAIGLGDDRAQIQVVRIAEGAPNRIVTPYQNPKIITNVEHEAWSVGSVLYVLPLEAQTAIGGFIQDETGEFAVPIMLEVARIPPQEVRLEDPRFEPVVAGADDIAKGEPKTYVDEVVETLVNALNHEQIPGFRQLRATDRKIYVGPILMELVHSQQRGDLIVERHRIVNDGMETRRISEASFQVPGRMGVMVYPPLSEIAPGQEASVFILRRAGRG